MNVGGLQKAIQDGRIKNGQTLQTSDLVTTGLARFGKDGVRLLGKGALTAQLHLVVAYATEGAKASVEKAGGSVKITGIKDRTRMAKNGKPGKRVQRRVKAEETRVARAKDKAERMAAKGL